jgi:dihydrofolate reductase
VTLGLIWAQAHRGVVGRDGTLPWHLPEDLALFRQTTTGATVVMGRRTWQSLPERFRPLPNRANVVLTRQAGFAAPGAQVAPDLPTALAGHDGPVWAIGGASVWAEALPLAVRLVVTEVDLDVDGDTYAPVLDAQWRVENETGWQQSTSGLRYRVRRYGRVG